MALTLINLAGSNSMFGPRKAGSTNNFGTSLIPNNTYSTGGNLMIEAMPPPLIQNDRISFKDARQDEDINNTNDTIKNFRLANHNIVDVFYDHPYFAVGGILASLLLINKYWYNKRNDY